MSLNELADILIQSIRNCCSLRMLIIINQPIDLTNQVAGVKSKKRIPPKAIALHFHKELDDL